MKPNIYGLHHVTALASDAQKNVDFYAGILGLRMVKKTVNFDSTDVYHLYYGNEKGDPGTILTFFPYQGLPGGRKGKGQVITTSFSIPENSLTYWMKRLNRFNIDFENPGEHFDDEVSVYFEDQDGLGIELVVNKTDDRIGYGDGHIPSEVAIRGFYGITLSLGSFERTAELLTDQMDHRLIAEKGNRYRFSAANHTGGYVDILYNPDARQGMGGSGTVHHVAFATHNDQTQLEFREKLLNKNIVNPTPVIDRQYFHSIYFREPGGILFEAATSDIGFTIDEPAEHLGESLKLPPVAEKNRNEIEKLLKPVILDNDRFKD
jgi:glyoxalase family protein